MRRFGRFTSTIVHPIKIMTKNIGGKAKKRGRYPLSSSFIIANRWGRPSASQGDSEGQSAPQ
jgi:hypothetical protein